MADTEQEVQGKNGEIHVLQNGNGPAARPIGLADVDEADHSGTSVRLIRCTSARPNKVSAVLNRAIYVMS